jgi:ribosome-interacting GTPase 1
MMNEQSFELIGSCPVVLKRLNLKSNTKKELNVNRVITLRGSNWNIIYAVDCMKNNHKLMMIIKDGYKKIDELEAEINSLKKANSEINKHNRTLTVKVAKLEQELESRPATGRKRNNDIEDTEIIRMSQQGMSLRTISKETELSVNTIRDILETYKTNNTKVQGTMTREAKDKLNEYMRAYRAKNKDKIRQHHENYWQKKALI